MPELVIPDPDAVVQTPQEQAAAGGTPTSGNPADPESQVEDPTDLADELDDDDDPDDPDESDETGPATPALVKARKQAAKYRTDLRAVEADRDELAQALWVERVTALGTLADPTDMPFDPEALHDPDRLRELVDELVTAKPHLRSRRVRQRAGQGEGSTPGDVSLAAMLRRGA